MLKGNVVLWVKGNPPIEHVDSSILSCWMVDNDYANAVTDKSTIGNLLPGSLDALLKFNNVAIISMEKAADIILNDCPGLLGVERRVISDESCKEMYINTYSL